MELYFFFGNDGKRDRIINNGFWSLWTGVIFLELRDTHKGWIENFDVKNGHIRRIIDDEVKSLVLEISGTNVATTYITCPIKPRASLGIKLPFLVMVIKNMKKYFTFEIEILDDKDMHRRFRVSNFQSTTKVRPFCTTMPIGLSAGWNQIQFNLADFTRRAYGSTYVETMRVQIHANVRVRRIYFSDKLYSDEEMPNEFKLFVPPATKDKGPRKVSTSSKGKEAEARKLGSKEVPPIDTQRGEEIPSGAPPTPVGTVGSVLDTERPEEKQLEEVSEALAEEAPAEEIAPAEEGPMEGDLAEAPAEPPAEASAEETEGIAEQAAEPIEDEAPPAPEEGATALEAAPESTPETEPFETAPAEAAEVTEAPPAEEAAPEEPAPEAAAEPPPE